MYSAQAGEARTPRSTSLSRGASPVDASLDDRVGREGDGTPESLHSCSTKRKRHRMSGLIGRLISHLAQKYIVEALGSTSALSEP